MLFSKGLSFSKDTIIIIPSDEAITSMETIVKKSFDDIKSCICFSDYLNFITFDRFFKPKRSKKEKDILSVKDVFVSHGNLPLFIDVKSKIVRDQNTNITFNIENVLHEHNYTLIVINNFLINDDFVERFSSSEVLDSCPICFFHVEKEQNAHPDCKHSIHIECVKMMRNVLCPICRAEFSGTFFTPKLLSTMRKKFHDDNNERNEEQFREIIAADDHIEFQSIDMIQGIVNVLSMLQDEIERNVLFDEIEEEIYDAILDRNINVFDETYILYLMNLYPQVSEENLVELINEVYENVIE